MVSTRGLGTRTSEALRFRVLGFIGLRVLGVIVGFRVQGLGFIGLRVLGVIVGFRVQGLGFREGSLVMKRWAGF